MNPLAEISIEIKIGARIRLLREEKNVTLEQLAGKTNLTKGQLSKIENGKVSSPVSTLSRIAQALGVDIGFFFQNSEGESRSVLVKQSNRPIVVGRASKIGHTYRALTTALPYAKAFEPYMMTIDDPNLDPNQNVFRHSGHEFLFMTEGGMDYRVGDDVHHLDVGDSLFFDGMVEHGPIKLYDCPVQFMSIISNTNEPSQTPNISK
jgi:transcriptional regulator with XRE-family HTH domain